MKMADAVKMAERIAAGRCKCTPHYGTDRRTNRAVRLSNCFPEEARTVGQEIALELPGGAFRQSAGFACVWFD